ncbi:hypothetical protein D3C81_1396760 [compost metagenome]
MGMKKKWTLILTTAALSTAIISATAFAASELNLFINGQGYKPDYLKMKVEHGTTMVSLRSIVDEFKGQVTVERNNVRITLPDAANLSNQVKRFEDALAAANPEDAVRTWIKGVQNRNGALQYAVLSKNLRAQTLKDFNDNYWVTGGSSPHMGEVKLPPSVKLSKDQVQFTFEYPLIVMEKSIGSGKAQITVQRILSESSESWVISNIKLKDPEDTGLMIGAQQLN